MTRSGRRDGVLPGAALLFAALVILTTEMRGQERADGGVDGRQADDSSRVSRLEEQLAGEGDGEDLERIEVRPADRQGSWRASWRFRTGGVFQRAAGYTDGTFAGDGLKLFQKLSLRYGRTFSAEILTDKDPGERSVTDFVSGAVSAGLVPGRLRLVAGDFRVRSGQGLLFGGSRTFGKGAAVIEPAVRESLGLPEGISSDEARSFRGAAVDARAGPVACFAFASVRRRSGIYDGGGLLKGVDESGYHRTTTEIARRNTLLQRDFGGAVRLAVPGRCSVGAGLLSSILAPASASGGGDRPGSVAFNRWSLEFRAAIGGLTLFGEVLPSGSVTPWIAGALLTGGGGSRAVIVRRFYPPADPFHGTSGFGDASGGVNEEGTYIGVELAMHRVLSVSGYLDLYSRVGPVQGAVQPPAGRDGLLCVRLEPGAGWAAELRFRSRARETGVPDVAGVGLPVPGNALHLERRVRADVRWRPEPWLSCGLRLDGCLVTPGGGDAERGTMATAELVAEPWRGVRFDAATRLFSTRSFASGIPSVDVDIPGTIASTVYHGEGSALSAGLAWRWSRHFRLALRYSALRRDDLRAIGAGPAELPSNIREKAGLQVDIAL